jgi:hypothetical protein
MHEPHPHPLHHCHGCISRRQCLKLISTAALGLSFTGGLVSASAAKPRKPAPDFVDPEQLRPHPKIKIEAAFLQKPRPYWLGWPGTAYDLNWAEKEYSTQLRQSCNRLGLDLNLSAKPIEKPEQVDELIKAVRERKPDALLVMLLHIHCWEWCERLVKEAKIPLMVFSPIGTSFTTTFRKVDRMIGAQVVSTLEWPAVEDCLKMVRAKRLFEESRILWIRKEKPAETVMERLGAKVRTVPRNTFNELFDKMPVNEEVKDTASSFRRGARKIIEPNWQDSLNSARAYTTAKRLLCDQQAHALSMDCLGMVTDKLVPTPPCGAWTILQDEGITAGCEADLHASTSMMLSSYLLDRPGFINDPVAETAKNLLIASHCTSGTRLQGFKKPRASYILRSHSESDIGVSVQVLWPQGAPVTLIRFRNPNELIIDTGKVVSNVNTPPAGGCRTSFEIQMDHIEDCRDVLGFHQVVVLGNHRRILEGFCQLYGIEVVHSPREHQDPKQPQEAKEKKA